MKRTTQLVSVLLAWMLVAVWFWFLIAFPKSWQNPYDCLNEVMADIFVSFAMLLLGLALCIEATLKIVRWTFALSVILAPVGHLVGSTFEPPLCILLFVLPSFGVLLTGMLELEGASAKSAPTPDSNAK